MRTFFDRRNLPTWLQGLRLAWQVLLRLVAPAVGVVLGSVLSGMAAGETQASAVAAGGLIGLCAAAFLFRRLHVNQILATIGLAATILAMQASWLQGTFAAGAVLAVWMGGRPSFRLAAWPVFAALVVMLGASPAGSLGPVLFAAILAGVAAYAQMALGKKHPSPVLPAGAVCLVLVFSPLPFLLFEFRGLYLLLLVVADSVLLAALWLLLGVRAPARARGMVQLAMMAMAIALYFGAIVQLGE